jgi:hypothetical protein
MGLERFNVEGRNRNAKGQHGSPIIRTPIHWKFKILLFFFFFKGLQLKCKHLQNLTSFDKEGCSRKAKGQ